MTGPELYWYEADVTRVVDGDTLDVRIDVGFRGTRVERLRLADIDAWEKRGEHREKGRAAQRFVENWLSEHGARVLIRTAKGDSFGRWIAHIHPLEGGPALNDQLVERGHAIYKSY